MVTASDQVSSSILQLASQRALLGVPQYLTLSCHETRLAEKDPPFHNIECSGADLPSARHKLDVSEVPSLLPWACRQSQTIGSIQTDSLWGVIFVKRHNTKVTQQTWKKIPKTLHVTPCHSSNFDTPAKARTGHMQLDRLCQVPRQQHKPMRILATKISCSCHGSLAFRQTHKTSMKSSATWWCFVCQGALDCHQMSRSTEHDQNHRPSHTLIENHRLELQLVVSRLGSKQSINETMENCPETQVHR